MDLSDYIIIVLIFIIIYLLYNNYIEKFTTTGDITLAQKINNTFKVEMSGIRDLKPIIDAFESTRQDRYYTNVIDLNNYNVSELIINNSNFFNTSTTDNMDIIGNLYIKDYTNINLCPRGVIITWATIDIPNGWLICDGSIWWISKLPNLQDTKTEPPVADLIKYDKIVLPDLRGKFVLNTFNYPTNTYEYGGEEQVTLNFTDMPSHKHYNSKMLVSSGWGSNYVDEYKNLKYNNQSSLPINKGNIAPYFRISYDSHSEASDDEYMLPAMYIYPNNPYNSVIGTDNNLLNSKVQYMDLNKNHGDMPHNNMPPYYSLIYIMKK